MVALNYSLKTHMEHVRVRTHKAITSTEPLNDSYKSEGSLRDCVFSCLGLCMNNQPHLPENCRPTQMLYKVSFAPMLTCTPLFVFSIITEAEEQQKMRKVWEDLSHDVYTRWTRGEGGGGGRGAQLQIRVQ